MPLSSRPDFSGPLDGLVVWQAGLQAGRCSWNHGELSYVWSPLWPTECLSLLKWRLCTAQPLLMPACTPAGWSGMQGSPESKGGRESKVYWNAKVYTGMQDK